MSIGKGMSVVSRPAWVLIKRYLSSTNWCSCTIGTQPSPCSTSQNTGIPMAA